MSRNSSILIACASVILLFPLGASAGGKAKRKQVRRAQLTVKYLPTRTGASHVRSQIGFFGRSVTAKHNGRAVEIGLEGHKNGGFKPSSVAPIQKQQRAQLFLPISQRGNLVIDVDHSEGKKGFNMDTAFPIGEGQVSMSLFARPHRPAWRGEFVLRYTGPEMGGTPLGALQFFAGYNLEGLLSQHEFDRVGYVMRFRSPNSQSFQETTEWTVDSIPNLKFVHEQALGKGTLTLSLAPGDSRTFSTDVGTFAASFLHQAIN